MELNAAIALIARYEYLNSIKFTFNYPDDVVKQFLDSLNEQENEVMQTYFNEHAASRRKVKSMFLPATND